MDIKETKTYFKQNFYIMEVLLMFYICTEISLNRTLGTMSLLDVLAPPTTLLTLHMDIDMTFTKT